MALTVLFFAEVINSGKGDSRKKMSTVSERIIELRKKEGLTQESLAEMLFVSRTLISNWETGKRVPDRYNLGKMAEIFNVREEDILPDDMYIYSSPEESETVRKETEEFTKEGEANEDREDILRDTEILTDFLSRLSEKDEKLFMSRYFYGKRYKTIAEESGISDDSVKTRLYRIRKRLRRFIEERSK